MRRWFRLTHLPIAIGAFMLVMPWFYLTWNTTLGELVPAIRFRTKQTIAGVVQEAAPTLTLHALLTGQYQQSISRAVGILSPIFKPAIRWKNQIYYTLLGTAGSDRVVVGRDRQLLEMTYLDEYCSRDLATFRPKAEDWVGRLRTMQDFFEARGQAFAYVITPSKVAQNPQFIPESYACSAHPDDRARKLEVFDAILKRRGVRFVDGASNLAAARETYGIDMFPRGGIHWNALAAALATQDLVATLNAERAAPPLTSFRFTWRVSMNPVGADRDLLDMMNLPHPDRTYPVPVLDFQSADPPGGCRTVRIAEVGGSFLMGLNDVLEKLACPPDIAYWFYWDHNRFRYAEGRMRELPMDADVRRKSLLDADVVLFEENESALPDSKQGSLFLDELARIGAGR